MNKLKKFLATSLAVITAFSAGATLAGCGGGDDGSSSSSSGPDIGLLGPADAPLQAPTFEIPEGGYDGSKQTVVFYHTMGQDLQKVLNNYVTIFNLMFPNITIDHKQVGGYEDVRDNIVTELIAGVGPNMAYCYPDHVALYNRAAKVLTLDDLIASEVEVTYNDPLQNNQSVTVPLGFTQEQINNFIPGYYNEGKAFGNDKMYMLPFSKSTEVLYYNKTFFEANNLQLPTTWDEMDTLVKRIVEIDPYSIPLGYDSEANWFITMTQQQGSPYTSAEKGNHFLFDTEENWQFVERFRDWYYNSYVTTQELYGSYTSSLFTSTDQIKSYMSIGSSAGASKQCPTANAKGEFPFEVGIATIPQVDPEHPKVISQGPSVCMFDKGAGKEQEMIATWLFMKFLTSTELFQAAFSMASGYVPVLNSCMTNDIYANHLNKANGNSTTGVTALAAKVCMEQSEAYFVSPAFYGSSVARDEVGLLMQSCFVNSPKSGQTLREFIQEEFDKTIARCNSKIS